MKYGRPRIPPSARDEPRNLELIGGELADMQDLFPVGWCYSGGHEAGIAAALSITDATTAA